MKKILVLMAILSLAGTSCYADVASGTTGAITFGEGTTGLNLHGSVSTTAASADTALIGKCSTGVGAGWNTDANGYALVTQHKSGSKAYGSSYDSTALYQYVPTGTPGEVILANPTDTTTTSFVSADWKKM